MRTKTSLCLRRLALVAGFLLAGSASSALAQSVTDDFNDGNDAGWTRYNPLGQFGLNASYTFPNGGYRIQTPYVTGQAANPGRAGTVRPELYSDFYVSVDVVNWDDTLPQSAGLLARVGTVGLQTTTGYAFTWDRGNPTNATAGDVDISSLTGEAPDGVSVSGSDKIHFENGKTYRMVFIGRGAILEGRVYELPDTRTPVLTVVGSDSTYPSGQNGMVVYDNNRGQSKTDVTFDNYFATDVEPPQIKMTDLGFGAWELSWPAEASAFVLQSSTVLSGTSADWVNVPLTDIFLPSDIAPFYRYTMDTTENGGLPKKFFRLVR